MNMLLNDLFIDDNWYVKMLYLMFKPIIVVFASLITAVIIDFTKRMVREEKCEKY